MATVPSNRNPEARIRFRVGVRLGVILFVINIEKSGLNLAASWPASQPGRFSINKQQVSQSEGVPMGARRPVPDFS